MTEERDDAVASGEEADRLKSKEKKSKNKPFTKIILRHLPPSMTEESFLEQVSPIPEHDYFYFTKPDPSLMHCGFSRAYINFINTEDIYLFKDKFDGYIFLDEKGQEYMGIVEYAPFQRVPKKQRKKDPKCGTIESDPDYEKFLESLKEPENENREPKLEFSYPVNDSNDKKSTSTPLLEFLASRKLDKRNREERRRREADKRKVRVDRKTKEATIQEEDSQEEVKKIKPREWEKDKISSKNKEEDNSSESKDYKSSIKSSKSFRENRKLEGEKRDYKIKDNENDKLFKKERRDKIRELPREHKAKEVKKYSEVRKVKSKETEVEVIEKVERKTPKIKDSDIKPFTQLPPVKTEDLTKMVEEMDRLMKEEKKSSVKNSKLENNPTNEKSSEKTILPEKTNSRKKSLESSSENNETNDNHNSDDRSKSTDRDSSVEKDKGDPRTERRIRNKDRPSMAIYQPGMGKFSKQRIGKDKENVSGTEMDSQDKKDT